MRIFIGNLPFSATERDLENLFAEFGRVESVSLVRDRADPERTRGFGFVDLPDEAAEKAILALDKTELGGRRLRVAPATPRAGAV